MSSPGATWAGAPAPPLPSLRGPAASLQLALLLRGPHPPSGCPLALARAGCAGLPRSGGMGSRHSIPPPRPATHWPP